MPCWCGFWNRVCVHRTRLYSAYWLSNRGLRVVTAGLVVFSILYNGLRTLQAPHHVSREATVAFRSVDIDLPTSTNTTELSNRHHHPHTSGRRHTKQTILTNSHNNKSSVYSQSLPQTLSGNTQKNSYPASESSHLGILSKQSISFFRALQQQVDSYDATARCARYGFKYDATRRRQRRIFYGALLSNEPWELMEIIATETFGVYTGMVLVQSNRTQNFSPRPLRNATHARIIAQLFNTTVDLRTYVNESARLRGLGREHMQRSEIIAGWQSMGMQPNDVGLLADADETFSRDALRAIQTCEIPALDCEHHHCRHGRNGLRGYLQIYESSPECIMRDRLWLKPDVLIGHCIEGIGDANKNKLSPRDASGWHRLDGYGGHSNWTIADPNNIYPLYNAADFRRIGGGVGMMLRHRRRDSTINTEAFHVVSGYHFHNFFSSANAIKFKYRTYGHPRPDAYKQRLPQLHRDLAFMSHCVLQQPENWTYHRRVPAGFDALRSGPGNKPLYFHDGDYRQARHQFIADMVRADDAAVDNMWGAKH